MKQTYTDRELLIVASGEDVRDLVPADARIRLVHIDAAGYTIGEKRNFAAGLAGGDIIAHWDDDDYSAPGRIADQVERLTSSGLAVSGYKSMLFADGAEWWRYTGDVVGTSLCYRKSFWQDHPFPAKQIGEDGAFRDIARAAGQLDESGSDAVATMYATIHPGNTSPRSFDSRNWKRLTETENGNR